ncbi:PP2C family protein-serine/threonine phosphatase [Streptomyces sp. NPDC021100]|uniref:PP2C family protein-serine/threonine phosphatase n=1 Tax=Streptomyces sp. NPDC021100 TaxID=3365114 RepID=UPI0037879B89
MITHATAQRIGTRSHQCDATSTATDRGTRAWTLLDGIGSTTAVRNWTRTQARLLARVGALTANPCAALAAVRAAVDHQDPQARRDLESFDEPSAVAVVAVRAEGGPLRVAWCGDARAYWLAPGKDLRRLTRDHNEAERARAEGRSAPRWHRNIVTSHLGRHPETGAFGELGTAPPVRGAGRLLLCSDGVYSPFEDHDRDMSALLARGTPRAAATALVTTAVTLPDERHDNATALIVDFA